MVCNLKGQALALCEQMKEVLGRDNIHAKILDNVIYDEKAMSGLEHEKCAVLVEQAGSTRYGEIAQELELLERQGIRVLGEIIVEGLHRYIAPHAGGHRHHAFGLRCPPSDCRLIRILHQG